jgi:hypothetical protein
MHLIFGGIWGVAVSIACGALGWDVFFSWQYWAMLVPGCLLGAWVSQKINSEHDHDIKPKRSRKDRIAELMGE